MDFTLPEAATDLIGLTRDIATKISTPERVAELEAAAAPIDDVLWRELGTAGLLGLEVPSSMVADAGGDLSAVENCVVATELGRSLARVPFGPHAIAALPVLAARAGADLREQVLARGSRGAAVITVAFEEDLGPEVTNPSATLVDGEGDTLRLWGAKVNVPYGQAADAFLVNASGPDGIVAVAVFADAPGVDVTATRCTGLLPTAEVEFSDVAVARGHILYGGADAVTAIANRLSLAVSGEQSGIVSRALELTAEYAREREQFGRAIGSFQAVAQRLADGYIDAQALSLTTTQAAWLLANTDSAGNTVGATQAELHTAIATAKFWAADAGHRVAHTAVHVHGGVGLDTSHPVHRYFLRAKQNEFSCGNAPATLRNIGTALAAAPA